MVMPEKDILIRTGSGAILSFTVTICFGMVLGLVEKSDFSEALTLVIMFLLSFVYLASYLGTISGTITIVEKVQKKVINNE